MNGMNEHALAEQQKRLLAQVAGWVEERAAGEERIGRQQAEQDAAILSEYQARRDALAAEFQETVTRLRAEYQQAREAVIYAYESDSYTVVQDAERIEAQSLAERNRAWERAKAAWEEARRRAGERYAAEKDRPQRERQRWQRRAVAMREEIEQVRAEGDRLIARRGCRMPEELPAGGGWEAGKASPVEGGSRNAAEPWVRAEHGLETAHDVLHTIRQQPAARFLEDGWPFLIFLFTTLLLAVPGVWWLDWLWGLGGAGLIAGPAAWLVRRQVRPRAQRQTMALVPDFLQELSAVEQAIQRGLDAAADRAERQQEELIERRERAVSQAHARWSRTRTEVAEHHQQHLERTAQHTREQRKQLKERFQRDLQAVDQQYPSQIDRCERRFAEESQLLLDHRQQQLAASHRAAEREWDQLAQRWFAGMDAFQAEVERMQGLCEKHFPPWNQVDWSEWPPDDRDLPALRFGWLQFALETLPDGLPRAPGLQRSPTRFAFPAALAYPDCPSLLYLTEGDGREAAIRSLQNVTLRLLTSLPPGKVRFTIIDPTGLGQNFSAFMHLADFDERLVSSRIWTETVHINQRLADLTQHMEDVIQKYLRNEFDSIQEYNRRAGEVAEPFQVLVIANFPANFNEESARRLVSIASSGPRCGVYTLISVDRRLKLPPNFHLDDLKPGAAVLQWDESQAAYRWADPALGQLPLTLDDPPAGDRFTEIVRVVGERSKDARRVEVPFETIVPPDAQWWSGDSRSELEVPLGRAGATNLQTMRLGRGTSQHVLIAGKTGSGKSTLLHALITSLSIRYSPEQVQFYLIDFKKGVEFKAYASGQLPHARVIAIESEREFGMSVLERLDRELKERGDRFREQGVQDLRASRDVCPDHPLPRLLLIIDEFQEFFVKDDAIAQEAALLLDRLVRQGRAFGMHVLLGSQTLAGAYTLARSTLGQMAVRIALQCSETDAHLILSDDNTAARLLSRPGEAIYNDANGLFEGNHPFQVVWLPDEQREHYLGRLGTLARQRRCQLPPPIVFEGNLPADPSKNPHLQAALQATPPGDHARAPRAWLGEAISIKDPAAAVFHRQSGSNLVIVGQDESAAMALLANSVISLMADTTPAASGPHNGDFAHTRRTPSEPSPADVPPGARWVILDGLRSESPWAGFWQRLAGLLDLSARIADVNHAAPAVQQLAEQVEQRLAEDREDLPPVFLLIYNLARFRDLRKSDDYHFSFEEDRNAGPDQQLATILREGPRLGIHSLIWCDNYANLSRWLDRQTLHDLAWRVLFQMSVTDSANLMDSPDAGRIGIHRAVLYQEERGEFEKFRPYGHPSAEWIGWLRNQRQDPAAKDVAKMLKEDEGLGVR